jgi:hypothetical protein
MIEDGIGVCRCLFNCSSEDNQVKKENFVFIFQIFFSRKICGSNGIIYRNLCEMERDRCIREYNLIPVDHTYCKLRVCLFT